MNELRCAALLRLVSDAVFGVASCVVVRTDASSVLPFGRHNNDITTAAKWNELSLSYTLNEWKIIERTLIQPGHTVTEYMEGRASHAFRPPGLRYIARIVSMVGQEWCDGPDSGSYASLWNRVGTLGWARTIDDINQKCFCVCFGERFDATVKVKGGGRHHHHIVVQFGEGQ